MYPNFWACHDDPFGKDPFLLEIPPYDITGAHLPDGVKNVKNCCSMDPVMHKILINPDGSRAHTKFGGMRCISCKEFFNRNQAGLQTVKFWFLNAATFGLCEYTCSI